MNLINIPSIDQCSPCERSSHLADDAIHAVYIILKLTQILSADPIVQI